MGRIDNDDVRYGVVMGNMCGIVDGVEGMSNEDDAFVEDALGRNGSALWGRKEA